MDMGPAPKFTSGNISMAMRSPKGPGTQGPGPNPKFTSWNISMAMNNPKGHGAQTLNSHPGNFNDDK